eukprot:8365243-Pyramimonas_sp.AAC.1
MPPPTPSVGPRDRHNPRATSQTQSGPSGEEATEFKARQARILKAQGQRHHLVLCPDFVFYRRCSSYAQ